MNAHTLPLHTQKHTYTHKEEDTHIYFVLFGNHFSLFIFWSDAVFIVVYMNGMECMGFCVFACEFVCLFMVVNICYSTMDANENNRHKKWHKRRKLQPNINYILCWAFSVCQICDFLLTLFRLLCATAANWYDCCQLLS